jgi:hypothetical protein
MSTSFYKSPPVKEDERDWMNSMKAPPSRGAGAVGGGIERPVTASAQNAAVRQV